jgi:predicted AAA+ superfamily ATPase
MAWARQHIDATVQRDVAGNEKLAQTAGQLRHYTHLAGQVGLEGKTAARYVGAFEQMQLLKRAEVWARNRLSRVFKTPKLQFIDSSVAIRAQRSCRPLAAAAL